MGPRQRAPGRHHFRCFLLLRKELWDRLGGFDTSFFMYTEDADLSLRARKLGYRPMFTPDATIMHLVGGSSSVKAERLIYMCRGSRLLIERHWSPAMKPFGLAMITLSVWTRMFASAALARLRPSRYTNLAVQWGPGLERAQRVGSDRRARRGVFPSSFPAHNEAAVIERCLGAILADAPPGTPEIIVVCNGCTDDTAARARKFGAGVTVIELERGIEAPSPSTPATAPRTRCRASSSTPTSK